jgi:hypothetical protein
MKPLLLITLFFALQLGGLKVYAISEDGQASKNQHEASVKQSVGHNQLIAETGAEIHLPALQITVQADACLTSGTQANLTAVTALYLSSQLTVQTSRYHRLILFPFHGFW